VGGPRTVGANLAMIGMSKRIRCGVVDDQQRLRRNQANRKQPSDYAALLYSHRLPAAAHDRRYVDLYQSSILDFIVTDAALLIHFARCCFVNCWPCACMRLIQAHRYEDRNHAETLLASAVLVLFAGQANAQIFSGNKLVEDMREVDKYDRGHPSPNFVSLGFYQGFVAGAFDAYDSAGMLCGTDQVTLGQVEAIVSRYLKAHPTKWHVPAIDLARGALLTAFPCPE
jgi:hypothetical protein